MKDHGKYTLLTKPEELIGQKITNACWLNDSQEFLIEFSKGKYLGIRGYCSYDDFELDLRCEKFSDETEVELKLLEEDELRRRLAAKRAKRAALALERDKRQYEILKARFEDPIINTYNDIRGD